MTLILAHYESKINTRLRNLLGFHFSLLVVVRLESLRNKIEGWGYDPILTNTKSGKNMPELLSILHGKRTVLIGESSAGKSTLFKHILMRCG
ncbi:hypothetical protein TSUD_387570 [Trifolium subterraneum]|uniref:EngC GTPase domain-containing protein n=1 Tax=Trifolium subterraneum TaxID=3900 RepID=A0A2Z6NL40_TRISU|nr:hypothetical protein TSUD_387570 [Trifolium subterraneum]